MGKPIFAGQVPTIKFTTFVRDWELNLKPAAQRKIRFHSTAITRMTTPITITMARALFAFSAMIFRLSIR
jgi:hypothetical protein